VALIFLEGFIMLPRRARSLSLTEISNIADKINPSRKLSVNYFSDLLKKLDNSRKFYPEDPSLVDDTSALVYRGVAPGRTPERKSYCDPVNVHKVGLPVLGTRKSIAQHVVNIAPPEAPEEEKTAYVAFTEELKIARQFAGWGGRVFISHPPEICIRVGAINLGNDLDLGFDNEGNPVAAQYKSEREIVSVGSVPATQIFGSREVLPFVGWKGDFVKNPFYKPSNFSVCILSADQEEADELAKSNPAPEGYRHVRIDEAEILLGALRDTRENQLTKEERLLSNCHYYVDCVPLGVKFEEIIELVVELYKQSIKDDALVNKVHFSNVHNTPPSTTSSLGIFGANKPVVLDDEDPEEDSSLEIKKQSIKKN